MVRLLISTFSLLLEVFILISIYSFSYIFYIYQDISFISIRIYLLYLLGVNLIKHSQELDKIPHIIVGTPGRIRQMLSIHQPLQKYILNLKYLVLDEVDRLIDTNIYHDLTHILNLLPKDNYKIFTSATVNINQINNKDFLELLAIKTIVHI